MKRLLLSIIVLLTTLAVSAYDIEVNGIYYNLVTKAKIAEICGSHDVADVIIPEYITYEGEQYTVTTICEMAFYKSPIVSIKIPQTVTSIEAGAFECKNLTAIHITDLEKWFKTSFGNNVFSPSCTHKLILNEKELSEVIVPASVVSLIRGPLECTQGITKITVPRTTKTIDSRAFWNSKDLVAIKIEGLDTKIGDYVFQNCTSLCDVILPEKITTISDRMFIGCTALEKIEIPQTVTHIGNGVFDGCSSLSKIVIPISVTSIGSYCFCECKALSSIVIPSNVISIGQNTFAGCTGLESVLYTGTITEIEANLFAGCTKLKTIEVPSGCKTISNFAFNGCSSLKTVNIPSSIVQIKSAFQNCKELSDIYCYSVTIPNTSQNAFEDSFIEYATLHVPAEVINDYKTTEPWSSFGKIVSLEGTEPKIKKCTTPTISYQNGKLTFNSDTEGVTFVSEIKDTDIKTYHTSEVALSATYTVSVYATATGYENSDIATATLCWLDAEPKTEGTTNDIAVTRGNAVLVQSRGGVVYIEGIADGTAVAVYSITGQTMGTATAHDGSCQIATSLNRGEVAVIRIGDKAVKVTIQ